MRLRRSLTARLPTAHNYEEKHTYDGRAIARRLYFRTVREADRNFPVPADCEKTAVLSRRLLQISFSIFPSVIPLSLNASTRTV